MRSTSNLLLKLGFLIMVLLIPAFSVSARHQKPKKMRGEEHIVINTPGIQADTIYYNGTVITLDEKQSIGDAIALKNYLILAVGSNSDILKFKGQNTRWINLQGKTVLPGFYDAHSHFMLNSLQSDQGFDLSPPPVGQVTKIQHIIDNVRDHIERTKPPAGKTVLGIGYSDIALDENRHPNKHDLDKIATDRAIMMLHSSMHIMAVNSYALQACNLTYQTIPHEMKQMFVSVDGELTGVIKETGLLKLGSLIKPILANETILENGFSDYYEMGFTTAHDVLFTYTMGYIFKNSHTDYRNITSHYFPINIDAYLMVSSPQAKSSWVEVLKTKKDNFKIKGIKFILDGSIQGYTAFLNKPYEVLPQSSGSHNSEYLYVVDRNQSCTPPNCGIQSYKNQSIVNQIIATAYENGVDVITHCNGDAAADQLIEAVRQAKRRFPNLAYQPRLIMIHAQTITNDQIAEMAKLHIHPSFFPAHTFYWGYDHNKTFLGPQRAARIDPANSALKHNLKFTLHNDACVTPLKPYGAFEIMWTAVNRLTEKENLTLGEDEKIPVIEALKAVTINAAWQAREEVHKGSLVAGKDADLIVVSDNPLKIDPYLLRKISVLQTIKDGQIIFTHKNYTDTLQSLTVQQQEPIRQQLRRM